MLTCEQYHERAIELLEKGTEVADTPRCHLTRGYAAMALAYAELAKTAPAEVIP